MYAEILAWFETAYPDFANPVEGDPIWACLQTAAFVAYSAVKQTNDAFLQTQVLYATGANLDVLGGNYGLTRIVKVAADLDADPPVAEVLETDTQFRARMFAQWEGLGVGTNGWYERHAIAASEEVKATQAVTPSAGNVKIYVQSEADDGGIATSALQTTVENYLNHETRRILNDTLTIESISTVNYTLTAEVEFKVGINATTALSDLIEAVEAWAKEQEKIGNDIPLSRLYAVLTPDTVQGVTLTSPTANVTAGDGEVPRASTITITAA